MRFLESMSNLLVLFLLVFLATTQQLLAVRTVRSSRRSASSPQQSRSLSNSEILWQQVRPCGFLVGSRLRGAVSVAHSFRGTESTGLAKRRSWHVGGGICCRMAFGGAAAGAALPGDFYKYMCTLQMHLYIPK